MNETPATLPPIPVLPASPEGDFLRRVALWPIRKPLPTPAMLTEIDRPAMIKLAQKHRLLPALSWAVAASGDIALWPELQAVQRRVSIRALRQAAETRRLLDLFARAGCRALVLKGQALSLQLYGRADLRMSSDIDFLVDPTMKTVAHNLMVKNGFTPIYPVDVETLSFINKDQVYTSNKLRVELHWRLFDNQALLPWSFDELWANRSSVILMESQEAPTLARHHHILYQALHGLKHGWRRARWLVDLTVALQDDADRKALFALAQHYNLIPALAHTTRLAQSVFEVDLPIPVPIRWHQRAIAGRIDQRIRHLIGIPMTPDDLDLATWAKQRFHEKLLDLLICPSLRGLLIEIKHYFIGIGDVIDAKLPKHLLWAYIAIRPILLLRRMVLRKRTHPRHPQ